MVAFNRWKWIGKWPLILWTSDGKARLEMTRHTAAITALAISHCSEYIVSGDLQGNILLWKRGGKLLKRIPAHAWCVSSLSFSADGQRLLSSSWDGTVKVWSLASALAISD
jgi:WD40 repeat protein